MALVQKNLPANAGDIRNAGSSFMHLKKKKEMQVQSLACEDSLEEGVATHSNVLAWGIPGTEEPGGLQSMGVTKSRT